MAMTIGSSSEEGAVAATALDSCLDEEVDEEVVVVDLHLLAVSTSAIANVL